MPSNLIGGQKIKARMIGDGTTAQKVKKRIVGNGVAAIVVWVNTIARQGILKNGTQTLAASNVWEKVTGFKLDAVYPDTDTAAPASNGLFVSGRASFVATGTITTGTTTSLTRGVRVVGNGSVLGETLVGNTSSTREVIAVVTDGTDTQLELHALVNSTGASNRILNADTTGLMYRTGSYYDLLADMPVTRNTLLEATLTPSDLAEWPRVPGSGIYLEAGTYQFIWNLYSPGWGTDWSIGVRIGSTENSQIFLGTTSNAWNRIIQTLTVPTAQYVTPTVTTSASGYTSILAGRLNLFVSKI